MNLLDVIQPKRLFEVHDNLLPIKERINLIYEKAIYVLVPVVSLHSQRSHRALKMHQYFKSLHDLAVNTPVGSKGFGARGVIKICVVNLQ